MLTITKVKFWFRTTVFFDLIKNRTPSRKCSLVSFVFHKFILSLFRSCLRRVWKSTENFLTESFRFYWEGCLVFVFCFKKFSFHFSRLARRTRERDRFLRSCLFLRELSLQSRFLLSLRISWNVSFWDLDIHQHAEETILRHGRSSTRISSWELFFLLVDRRAACAASHAATDDEKFHRSYSE